jgi:DNA-binding IclR family transcriptional regulator
MPQGKPPDLIQSVSRALRILDEVGTSAGGLTAREIAQRCDFRLGLASGV